MPSCLYIISIYNNVSEYILSKCYMSPASGLVSCAVNVLPAIVPPFLRYLTNSSHSASHLDVKSANSESSSSHATILLLATLAVLSGVCAALAGVCKREVAEYTSESSSNGDEMTSKEGSLAYHAVQSDEEQQEI